MSFVSICIKKEKKEEKEKKKEEVKITLISSWNLRRG